MNEWKGERENNPREMGEKPFKGLFTPELIKAKNGTIVYMI